MLIRLYVYDKATKVYLYTDIGNPDQVMASLGSTRDFTLTAPPDSSKQWRWVGGRWV